ncbi:MAG: putative transrane protein [Rhizobacter sp.]|nr:putative transrane protein [Rhizobacter sp.]
MTQRPRSSTGIAYIVLTAGCFATSDATVKHLGAALPVLVMLWARYVFQATIMASMQMTRRPWRELVRSGAPRLQALRSMLLVANAACSFVGLQYLPLPEYTALVMLAPVISTLLAATWLGERVTPLRWAMVALGFVGMLMIVRPGSGTLGPAVLYPIVAAVFFAFYQAVTQRLAAVDDLVTTNLLSSLGALAVTCVAVLLLPIDTVGALSGASTVEWMLLVGLGAVASLGQISMTLAIRAAPLSVLTPFGYVQIAFAAFIGWLMFRHSPDHWSLAGMALIAVAGGATVILNQREKAVARRVLTGR